MGRRWTKGYERRRESARPRETVRTTRPHAEWGRRYSAVRGLYRVFAAAVFRLYRSSSGPPAETDTPFATSATFPVTPGTAFADGLWFLSVSYFNGVVDSGFLPIGANGETYVAISVSAGVSGAPPPAAPLKPRLELRPGGVVRVVAYYGETGASRADEWAVAYTTDGSSPTPDAPDVTVDFTDETSAQVLVLDLPAQANGTTVKVIVQTSRAGVFSEFDELTAVADAVGPGAIQGPSSWRGELPAGVS